MRRGEVPLDQNLEIPVSQAVEKDADEAERDKAVLRQKEVYDAQQCPDQELPARVVSVDDPLRQWAFTLKEIFTFLVQLLNIIAVLVFGVWAIRSYNEAVTANQLSSDSIHAAQQALNVAQAANALTMFRICQGNVDDKAQALQNCYPILNNVALAQPLHNALNSDLSVYATQITSTKAVSTSLTSLFSKSSLSNSTSSISASTSPSVELSNLLISAPSTTSVSTSSSSLSSKPSLSTSTFSISASIYPPVVYSTSHTSAPWIKFSPSMSTSSQTSSSPSSTATPALSSPQSSSLSFGCRDCAHSWDCCFDTFDNRSGGGFMALSSAPG